MPATTQVIYTGNLPNDTPTDSDWFRDADFLFITSPDVGEYLVTDELIEVNASLILEVVGGTERVIQTIDRISTAQAIEIPSAFRNDCFRMKLCFQPSTGFTVTAFAINCEDPLQQCCREINTKLDAILLTQAAHTFELGVVLAGQLAQSLLLTGMATALSLPAGVSVAIDLVIAYLSTRALPILP